MERVKGGGVGRRKKKKKTKKIVETQCGHGRNVCFIGLERNLPKGRVGLTDKNPRHKKKRGFENISSKKRPVLEGEMGQSLLILARGTTREKVPGGQSKKVRKKRYADQGPEISRTSSF